MKTSSLCILLSTFIASVSTISGAADLGDAAPNRVVKFGDLDLTRSAGAVALYSRINSAAREVCQPPNYRSLKSDFRARQCTNEAIGHAVADINAPALTHYYLVQTGKKSKFAETATIAREH